MSGPKTPKSTSTTTQQVFSPEETAARNKLFEAGSTAFDQQNSALQNAGNPAAKPVAFSPETLQAQNQLKSYATGAGAQTVDNLGNAINYGLNGAMDVNNNPYLGKAIDAALTGLNRNYTDPNGVLAQIRSSSIANGQYGGTRQGLAEGIAAGRYQQEAGNIASTMASNAYNQGQDTFARTLGLAPGAMSASLLPAQMLSAVGAQNDLFNQSLEDYAAAGRAFDLNKPFGAVANYANLINGIQAPGTSAENSVSQSGAGKAGGMIGGGLSGAMSGAMMGSMFPGVGTAMGAMLGGGLGVLSGLF